MRVPILLYQVGLGRILGGRFLMLTHIGRNSGILKRVVLEVIKSEPESGIYYIQIFVWESITNPEALSPPLSMTVNVSDHKS